MNSDGSSVPGWPITAVSISLSSHHPLFAADFDSDSIFELGYTNVGDDVRVYRGNGTLLWQSTSTGGGTSSNGRVADIDLDGILDVLLKNISQIPATISAFHDSGMGLGVATSLFPIPATEGPLAVADLEGDGVFEIVGLRQFGIFGPHSLTVIKIANYNGNVLLSPFPDAYVNSRNTNAVQ